MPSQKTRADTLWEYFTGASSDGGTQTDPTACLGHYRSATEAQFLGIAIRNALSGLSVLHASGANPVGTGLITVSDPNTFTWTPPGQTSQGPPVNVGGSETDIAEGAALPGQYVRVACVPPLTVGQMQVDLSYLNNDVMGFSDVTIAQATAGLSNYRATMIRNEGPGGVTSFLRWLKLLGTQQVSNVGQLPSSGAGTIATSVNFNDWPTWGWCQIRTSGGTLREVVYYTSRTSTVLTVPAAGRARFGSTATAGASTDLLYPVPGIAIAKDATGALAFGTSIQTIANETTAPTSVTWNMGISSATALNFGNLAVGQQIGFWMWRQIPAGAIATPSALIQFKNSFTTY